MDPDREPGRHVYRVVQRTRPSRRFRLREHGDHRDRRRPLENHPPTVTAPSTEQVDEGASLSFTVTASDPDGDPVALSASAVPEGATFTDHGNNTGTFSWTPGSTQSGSHVVAFSGNDGHGATGTATTAITVNDVTPESRRRGSGRACLLGKFKTSKDATCFRVRAVNHSFDLRDVDLSSLRLTFQGQSIAALPRCAHRRPLPARRR